MTRGTDDFRPNFKLRAEGIPTIADDFIVTVELDGLGSTVVTTNDAADITGLDPSLFTCPAVTGTGTALGNFPAANTLQWDQTPNLGDDVLFAGAPGFTAGTITVT